MSVLSHMRTWWSAMWWSAIKSVPTILWCAVLLIAGALGLYLGALDLAWAESAKRTALIGAGTGLVLAASAVLFQPRAQVAIVSSLIAVFWAKMVYDTLGISVLPSWISHLEFFSNDNLARSLVIAALLFLSFFMFSALMLRIRRRASSPTIDKRQQLLPTIGDS